MSSHAPGLAALLVAALSAIGLSACASGAPEPEPVAPVEQPSAPRDLTAEIDAATAAGIEAGTCWHRSAALVALPEDADAELARRMIQPDRDPAERALLVEAVGRRGRADATANLRATALSGTVPDPLRQAAEVALYELGDTEIIDRQERELLNRHTDIAVAAPGRAERLARLYYRVGRFADAAALYTALVDDTPPGDRRAHYAYDLACNEALLGRLEPARAAAEIALKGSQADLDWMARDCDLALLHPDERFRSELAAARDRRAAERVARAAELPPEQRQYRLFQEAFRQAEEQWFVQYDEWMQGLAKWRAKRGLPRDAASAREYARETGPEPQRPAPDWIPRFEEWLALHRDDALGGRIRLDLMLIYSNEAGYRMASEDRVGTGLMAKAFLAVYVEALKQSPDTSDVGVLANDALVFADILERTEEIRAHMVAAVEARPYVAESAELRLQLADQQRHTDEAAARIAYEDVVRLHPESDEAETARGALYELDRLRPGLLAPAFETTDVRGAPVSLAALRGKVVLLDFWATWCGPCLAALPELRMLEAELRDDGLVVLGISLDEDGYALAEFLDAAPMPWTQVCDGGGWDSPIAKLYNVRGVPTTVLIDPEGRIVQIDLGGAELRHKIRELLGLPVGTSAR